MDNIKMVVDNIKMVERKHVCPHCEFRTHRKYNLTMHIARIHKDVEGVNVDIPPLKTHRNPKKPIASGDQLEQELLEDSIHVLNVYNMLHKMKK